MTKDQGQTYRCETFYFLQIIVAPSFVLRHSSFLNVPPANYPRFPVPPPQVHRLAK